MGPDILIPLGFFAMITVIVVMIARYRNRERMALIKQGMNPLPVVPGKGSLMWGLLLTFTGVGFAAAVVLVDMDAEAIVVSALAVPAGLALLLFYKLTLPDREKMEELYREMAESPAVRKQPDSSPDVTFEEPSS